MPAPFLASFVGLTVQLFFVCCPVCSAMLLLLACCPGCCHCSSPAVLAFLQYFLTVARLAPTCPLNWGTRRDLLGEPEPLPALTAPVPRFFVEAPTFRYCLSACWKGLCSTRLLKPKAKKTVIAVQHWFNAHATKHSQATNTMVNISSTAGISGGQQPGRACLLPYEGVMGSPNNWKSETEMGDVAVENPLEPLPLLMNVHTHSTPRF